ncbi:MAG: zinc-binding dehydrogenase [Planctomycetaceae bacterium]|nr:zinc-binding dehydrogenase [Planctomycetaceae bacterium]
MKALVLKELKKPYELENRDDPVPGPGEAVVSLKAAAFNRRDYWITQGMYPGIELPVIPGSDGAGIVKAIGEGVDETFLEREVIIDPGMDWGDDENVQSDRFHILGMPMDGTFAEQVVVPASQLHDKPDHLSWPEAAALPLAGVTGYRALFTQGKLQTGEHVLITGIGGGVATFALQYAIAAGATVTVTSSSEGKRNFAQKLGAVAGYDYRSDDWGKQLVAEHGAPDLIIDSAGGDGYRTLLEIAAPGGRIVNYGATAGPPGKLDLFKLFWKQLQLIGSTMGSPADFVSMLEFVKQHQIKPLIDRTVPLKDANENLEAMATSEQFGKLVLEIG